MGPVGIFMAQACMFLLTSAVAISSSSMREDDKASVYWSKEGETSGDDFRFQRRRL
jgi:hypothetical protein